MEPFKKITEIPTVHSESQLEEFIVRNKPCKIHPDYARSWPAMNPNSGHKWTSAYLRQKVPQDRALPLRTNFSLEREDEWLGEEESVPFGKFLDHWEKNFTWTPQADEQRDTQFYYLASLPIKTHFPEIEEDISPPSWPKIQKKAGNLWLGNKGQITKLHHDHSTGDPGMDGLHFMIEGQKKWLLFDPADNAYTIPRKKIWGRFHQAIVKTETGLPDSTVFPKFSNSIAYEIFLEAGEGLYIPKCWWHHVVTTERGIAVNFWFQSFQSEMIKLGPMWPHVDSYLLAVAQMTISPDKMRNVLQFYGYGKKRKEKKKKGIVNINNNANNNANNNINNTANNNINNNANNNANNNINNNANDNVNNNANDNANNNANDNVNNNANNNANNNNIDNEKTAQIEIVKKQSKLEQLKNDPDSFDALVEFCIHNPLQFMRLPEFQETFANGVRAPWIKNSETEQWGRQMVARVRTWVEDKISSQEE